MAVTILRANATDLPLADESVDLVVTSPPYFALRSYQDGGTHYAGQLGSEPTPAKFVDALIAVTRECVRVLKPSGSLWVNLGDKYVADNRGSGTDRKRGDAKWAPVGPAGYPTGGMRQKSLMGIPWRYALRCIDDLGLILRAEVIWSKPNGLPESVTDRVRRSHEQWFHFVRQPRYYSAVDEIREAHAPKTLTHRGGGQAYGNDRNPDNHWGNPNGKARVVDPLGKLPGSVWSINEGESLVRSILSAVAAGALTVDEGERVWTGASDSCATSTWWNPAAGNGRATANPADTAKQPRSSDEARTTPTASPTSCTSDPSQRDSPSTISAETDNASGPTTSSPSPSERTSDAPTPSEPTAHTAIPSSTPTSNGHPQASHTRDAGPVSSPGSDVGESVWQVPTQPLKVPPELGIDHFAAFPMDFPRRIIRGWSPPGICTACGEGRRPVVDKDTIPTQGPPVINRYEGKETEYQHNWKGVKPLTGRTEATITGYACACPDTTAPTRPAVVLDPFGGTGTTALVAHALGRHGISVDLSADYCRLARWRTSDEGELARALQVDKPAVQVDGQGSLLDLLEEGA